MRTIINVLTIILSILFVQCSVQKRHYRSGYHLERHHTLVSKDAKPNRVERVAEMPTELKAETTPLTIQPKVRHQPPDTCDLMTFQDGAESAIKVIEITSKDVKYKRCDYPSGPTYVTLKSDVFKIKYANGSQEVFGKPAATQTPNQSYSPKTKPSKKRLLPLALFSMLLSAANAGMGVIFLWILILSIFTIPAYAVLVFGLIALAALIMAILANQTIKANREDYKGFGMTIPAIIISALTLVFVVFIGLVILLL